MTPRSQRHHQVPIWLLKHFSWKRLKSKIVWVGFKDTRDVKPVPVKDALFRNNATPELTTRLRGWKSPSSEIGQRRKDSCRL